jgi:hypothetical protein
MNMRRLLPAVAVALALLPLARLGKAQMYYPPAGVGGYPGAQMSQPYPQGVMQTYYQTAPAGSVQPGIPTAQPSAQCAAPQSACAGTCPACGDNCACGSDWKIFGGAIYLQPRNAGIEYAVPINGPIVPGVTPLQMGATEIVAPDRKLGFYFGATKALDECCGISVEYSYYANIATDSVSVNAPLGLQSMVMNPSSADAATSWNSASAREFIGFQLADADYRCLMYRDPCSSVNYLLGIRYGHLGQEFDAIYQSNYTAAVGSSVNFDGVGLRAGLEAERHNCYGLFVYGKTSASLLGGNDQAKYLQTSSLVAGPVATTSWAEARCVPMLDGELGIGWERPGGHFRGSIGYVMAGWLNVVKPSDYINSVQANNYHEANALGQSDMVFDGFVSHMELTW